MFACMCICGVYKLIMVLLFHRHKQEMASRKHKRFQSTSVVPDNVKNMAFSLAANGLTHRLCQIIVSGLVSVNIMYEDGCTLLHFAAAGGHTETVLILIELGADKAIIANKFGTPLHVAAANGHVSTVKAMLRAGCPVDVVDNDGCSVLLAAAVNGNAEMIREIVSTPGCDINAADRSHMTPLHKVAQHGKTEAALELIRHGAKKALASYELGTPLHVAAVFGHVSTVKAMLRVGCPVDVVNNEGYSVLHFAAQGGNAEVIRELLSTGCDMNAAGNDGRTPLHMAAVKGCTCRGSIGVDQTWG